MKLSKQIIPTDLMELHRQIIDSRHPQSSKRQPPPKRSSQHSSNPYGDKFSQVNPSSQNKSFNTDDWIMNRSSPKVQQQQSKSHSLRPNRTGQRSSRPSYENEFEDASGSEDEATFDFLNTSKRGESYKSRGASSPPSSDGKPKFSSFEELMQSLKSSGKF
jgi:hypothetical protein